MVDQADDGNLRVERSGEFTPGRRYFNHSNVTMTVVVARAFGG